MTAKTYHELILAGIQGLPPEILAQIAEYTYFLRQKALRPESFEETLYETLLQMELTQLDRYEAEHLESEFKDYDSKYPHE